VWLAGKSDGRPVRATTSTIREARCVPYSGMSNISRGPGEHRLTIPCPGDSAGDEESVSAVPGVEDMFARDRVPLALSFFWVWAGANLSSRARYRRVRGTASNQAGLSAKLH